MFRERFCDRCVHDAHGENACAVWWLHLEHNYDQMKNPGLKDVLDALIPRDRAGNGQCRMFLPEKGQP